MEERVMSNNKILTKNEREALITAYKQFINAGEVPGAMVLHATNGLFVGTLLGDDLIEYTTKGEGVKVENKHGNMVVEFRQNYIGYTYIFNRRKD